MTAEWVSACEMAGGIVSAEPYLLHGEHKSAKMGWSFDATVSRKLAASMASKGLGCFSGVVFHVTRDCVPSPAELAPIVAAAGGTLLDKVPTASSPPGVIVISTAAEATVWRKLAMLPSVQAVLQLDHFLTCLLRQTLDTTNGCLTSTL